MIYGNHTAYTFATIIILAVYMHAISCLNVKEITCTGYRSSSWVQNTNIAAQFDVQLTNYIVTL